MATKNEKTLAYCVNSLLKELTRRGMTISEEFSGMPDLLNDILNEEESRGKSVDERFYYTGVEAVTMSQDERDKLGICEFTVTYQGKVLLDIFWDTTLNWIMQPSEDGESFTACCERKFPGQAYARSFLKKLADEELENPGAFAKKYYKTKPTVVIRRHEATVSAA